LFTLHAAAELRLVGLASYIRYPSEPIGLERGGDVSTLAPIGISVLTI
jgi:hypothetical protein